MGRLDQVNVEAKAFSEFLSKVAVEADRLLTPGQRPTLCA